MYPSDPEFLVICHHDSRKTRRDKGRYGGEQSMRLACAIVLVMGLVLPAKAQDERGWSFSGSFSGSSNSGGTVMKTEPVLGYAVNKHLQTYIRLPLYFVHLSETP